MKKWLIVILLISAGMVVSLIAGYQYGYRDSLRLQCLLQNAPWAFYVQDTWHDCLSIRELKKGHIADVFHDLNMNLNQQIKILWETWELAPSESDRERAFDLLLDIAQHREDFELVSPTSKDGMWLYPALGEIMREARKRQASNKPSVTTR